MPTSPARQLPQISLTGSVGLGAVRSAGRHVHGNTWSLGPLSVSFPLFDAGARRAATAAAQAGYDEAVALAQAQLRRAVREVEASLAALQSSAEREADALAAARDFRIHAARHPGPPARRPGQPVRPGSRAAQCAGGATAR
jgi:multidrug efflux system outer membrane protein